MPSFVYKAKDASARTISGRMSASHQDEALDLLNRQGLVPVSIEEETGLGVLVKNIKEQKVKAKEIFIFTKQLAGLIKSGVLLLKALEVIATQTKNVYFSKIIAEMSVSVKAGRNFSSCLEDYPAIFSRFYVSMIRAGEEIGQLRQVLGDIAQLLKQQQEMNSKVRTALVYPTVMLCVGAATVFFILTFVLPKITTIFAGTGEQLPWPTLWVMAVSHFLRLYLVPIIVCVAISVLCVNRWRKSVKGQITVGFWILSLPFVRDLVVKAELNRFCRTLYLLLESGLTLIRAIPIAAGTVDNPQIKTDLLMCVDGLNAGENLGLCLQHSSYVPLVFAQTVIIAEESGELEDVLKDFSENCEAEVNEATKTLSTLLEPMLILGIGLVIGFIVFAMLMPIFSMDIMAR